MAGTLTPVHEITAELAVILVAARFDGEGQALLPHESVVAKEVP
jgi:hypothetical protein